MSKKVILFLSAFNAEQAKEQLYQCPSGLEFIGAQTNEAPVLYLLQTYDDISEIICVVTQKAKDSAWERFSDTVREAKPSVPLFPIAYEEAEDFSTAALPAILARVSRTDEILLETTGGFRNAIMYLLLVSRVLSYSGVRTVGAVYSSFQNSRVEDISHLVGLFDLVGGMQELTGFGSVRTLREYYKTRNQTEPAIDKLLSAMESLNGDVTLCRTARLDERIEAFNDAMDEAENCEDPLMRALLPAFHNKFGRRLSMPGLIKWCVNNDMIQQALTIYKERIPEYLFQRGILSVKPGSPEPENIQPYETKDAACFQEYLLGMGKMRAYYDREPGEDTLAAMLRNFDDLLPRSRFAWDGQYPLSRIQDIVMDYLYIRMLRNMINHANDQSVQSEGLMEYLVSCNYKNVNDTKTEDIKGALLRSIDRLQPPKRKEKKR